MYLCVNVSQHTHVHTLTCTAHLLLLNPPVPFGHNHTFAMCVWAFIHGWCVAYQCMCTVYLSVHVSAPHVLGFTSTAVFAHKVYFCSLCVSACVSIPSPPAHTFVCLCRFRAISKEANSLVDRNCYGLEVEPLAAVMQVEPHKPHQSQQQNNEAELPNRATPATTRLLLPRQRKAQLGRQHAQGQADSVGQAWGAGDRSS